MSAALPLPGYVYFDPSFTFHDGEIGRKLFVVLGDCPRVDKRVFVARTTSKPKSDKAYGCYPNVNPPCFFLPVDQTGLDIDTWVLFDYVNTYEYSDFNSWNRISELTIVQTKHLLNCGAESIYVAGFHTDAMQKQANELPG